jgi:hypothetical protein
MENLELQADENEANVNKAKLQKESVTIPTNQC